MTTFTKEQLTTWAEKLIEEAHSDIAISRTDAHAESYRAQIALLEIAQSVLAAKPFMYGIEDCDGMAYFAEHCVSSNPAHLSDELQTADDESGEGAKVIPLYRYWRGLE
ncbi:TPA: hypothetical protein JD836_14515 [Citrobacter freundii]|nr:hypothetical protein [Citrobacter freundii]HCD1268010.1 hypothetical protein [Citrobacter freundii]